MEYLLFICTEPFTPDEDPKEDMEKSTTAWVDDVDGRGVRKMGDRLRPASDATTVRVRHGELLISDGPFAETKEQICGYDLLECENLDEAIEVAARHPMARYGLIEVRPVWKF